MDDATRTALDAATETAVLVLVPEAEDAVAEHRRHLDMAASWGVPAHLSVVCPFVPPADVDDHVLARLAAAVGTVPAFNCVFSRTEWFGADVLWLAPDPDAPFQELISAVVAAFPAHLPYGGAYPDPVPHLTIGELRLGNAAELAAAERTVRLHLPIRARVDRAVLLAGRPERDSWRLVAELGLGAAA
jgi:2'-5' RNA ligase superfamily protein